MLKDEITSPLLDDRNDGSFPNIDFERIFNNEYAKESHESQHYYEEHVKNPERLAKLFRTDLTNGLDTKNKSDMDWREKKFGNNHLPPEEQHSFFFFVLECFGDPTLRILLIASIVSLIIGVLKDGIRTGWIEGTAIFFAVFLVVTISSYMNYDKEQQFVKLNREIKLKNVVVLRDGNEKQISLEDVLVGDILKLRIGDIINVDGLIYGNGKIQMSEAAVTGESDLLKKSPIWELKDDQKGYKGTPVLLSGSEILDGTGNMLVCAIGSNSFEGRNRLLLQAKNSGSEDDEGEKTPLQQQLTELANNIGNLGFIMAILIGCLMIIKNFTIKLYAGMPLMNSASLDILVNAFIIAVTVIVVAIPEGLPMAVTIALAYSVQKMKEEHNLVKHIEKSETMGNVNNVCTDKTGTLTLGEMQVICVWIEKNDYKLPNQMTSMSTRLTELLYNCIYKNISVVESKNEKGELVLNGDMTEKALYKFIKAANFSIREKYQGDIILPFKSEYKFMMSIYKNGKGGYILYGKGAPERIGEFFTSFLEKDGSVTPYADHKADLLRQQEIYADDSIRTLCFGYKELTKEEVDNAEKQFPEKDLEFFRILAQNLTFAFMLGIRDNNRPEVPGAILACKRAGIIVRMVTGDNINTALAISKDVGIIEPSEVREAKRIAESFRNVVNPNLKDLSLSKMVVGGANLKTESPIALEGEQFREVCGGLDQTVNPETGEVSCKLKDPERFKKIVKRLRVIARASPQDKFLLVLGLREFKHIVAVTGDGTNDAPALKQADVGFAMGIRGTDIAKGAADIVLLDDSFSSIVTACKFGRNVYDCIRKFIQFQLTTNVVAVFMTLLGGVILKDSPLNAIEMLWVNLIMDSFASLALATENPSEDLLNRKPYKRGGSLLTPMMKINIISQAIFQIIALTLMIFYGDLLFNVPSDRELEHFTWNNVNGYHFTIFFNTFVFMQVFNSINARKLNQNEYNVFSGILGNWYYIGVQAFIVFGQITLVTFGGRAVRTHALTAVQHLMCMGIASITIVVGFFVKLLPFDTTEPSTGEDEEEEKTKKKEQFSFGYRSRGNKIQFHNSMSGSRSKGGKA